MKPLEQKQIALLERMGWKWWEDSDAFLFSKEAGVNWKESRCPKDWKKPWVNRLPIITHDFMDEVWDWIRKQECRLFEDRYDMFLCAYIPKEELNPDAYLAHLIPTKKFEAVCKALGIE